MANEDVVTQYNQLVWQMEQLRSEVNEAGESYVNKLKSIKKRMQRTNEQLDNVSKELTRRQLTVVPVMAQANNSQHDAGFHPQS